MGQAFKIPNENCFLDSLVQGYYNNLEHKGHNLMILPSNFYIKVAKSLFNQYNHDKFLLPQFTTINDYLSIDDPFLIFPEYIELPSEINLAEFKIIIYNFFTKWSKSKIYQEKYSSYYLNKKDFTQRFTNLYLNIEEQLIDPYNIIKLRLTDNTISEQIILDFLNYFEPNWRNYKNEHKIVTLKEKQNLTLSKKVELLPKLTKFDNIILAGTTGINPLTMSLVSAVTKHPKGIFIYHEKQDSSNIINNIKPNLSIELLEKNLNIETIKYWHKKKVTQQTLTEIVTKEINLEAEYISKIIAASKKKQVILTNNQELRDLILFKINKYVDSLKFNLSGYDKIFKLFYCFYKLNNPEEIEHLFCFYLDIKIKIEHKEYYKIKKRPDEIVNFIAHHIPHELLNELEIFKNNIHKIYKKEFSQLLELINPEKKTIYYEDDKLLIIQPKELRLINYNNIIIADVNQDLWQSNIDKIFNLKAIKNNVINLQEIRESQISTDFFRVTKSKNIVFTRAQNKQDKENFIYIFYQYFKEQKLINCKSFSKKQIFFKKEHNILEIPYKLKIHDFYVTEIEKLLRNPYSIYALKILKLRKKDLFFSEEKNKIFGILVHKSLENFIKNIRNNSKLEKIALSNILSKLFAQELDFYKIPESIKFSWQQRFFYIANSFIENCTDTNIIAESLEELQIPDNNIKLKAKIDYISYDNEQIKIIDYKTGSLPNKSDLEQGYNGQLILALFITKQVRNIDKYQLEFWKLIGKKSNGIEIKTYPDDFISNSLKIVHSSISKLINDYQSKGLFCLPDEQKISKYDEYYHLARIDKN